MHAQIHIHPKGPHANKNEREQKHGQCNNSVCECSQTTW